MANSTVAILAFLAGAAVGALAVKWYVEANALEVLGPGAAEQLTAKIFGSGKLSQTVGGAVEGLLS